MFVYVQVLLFNPATIFDMKMLFAFMSATLQTRFYHDSKHY